MWRPSAPPYQKWRPRDALTLKIGLKLRTYNNVANGVERLKAMVADNFRQVCPENIARQPPPAKRRKREE